jgi:APA family basic amino acid/polyamine antiporter
MVVAIAMISFLTWLNTRGIVTGKTVQNIFSSTKVIALAGFIIIGLFALKSSNALEINREVFWQAGQTGSDNIIRSWVVLHLLQLLEQHLWVLFLLLMHGITSHILQEK